MRSAASSTATGSSRRTRPACDRPLAGLTLLEAAAVPGETLAADALANALAQVFIAAPAPGRVAVAMSGGVDSAVALLRAAPNAVGVTLRLWLDPRGPERGARVLLPGGRHRGARDVSRARASPRHARPARGVPRRPSSRRSSGGYARGLTPNPCIRCNGTFRFAALARLRGARGRGAALDRPLRPHRRAGRPAARRARRPTPRKDQSYMLATVAPAVLDARRLPARRADEGRDARRGGGGGARGRGARRESQEACFLAGGDYRAFLERHGVAPAPGPIVDEDGRARRAARRRLALHAGPAPRHRRRRARAALRAPRRRRARDPRRRARSGRSRAARRARRHAARPVERAEAKLRYRSDPVPPRVEATEDGFTLELERAGLGRRAGTGGGALRRDGAVVGAGIDPCDSRVGSPRMLTARRHRGRRRLLGARGLPRRVGLGTAYMFFKLGQAFGRLSSFISGTERDLLPVIVKTGGTVDRVNYQLDKADAVTDSAVSMADSADTAVRAVSMRDRDAGGEGLGRSRRRSRTGSPRCGRLAMSRRRQERGQGGRSAARGRSARTTCAPPAAREQTTERSPSRPRRPEPWPTPGADAGQARPGAARRTRGLDRRSLQSIHAHDGRAPRGLSLVLRGEGPPALPVRVARSRAPDDQSTLLTSAGMQPQMPYFLGLEPPPAPLTTTVQKVLPDPRHRGGRPRHVPPDVLRDARQLLVRPVLQGGRDRVRDRVHPRADAARLGPDLGERPRRRPRAEARARPGRDRPVGGHRDAAGAHRAAALLGELLVGGRPGAMRPGLGDLLRLGRRGRLRHGGLPARAARAASASSSSGISSSWSTSCGPTER